MLIFLMIMMIMTFITSITLSLGQSIRITKLEEKLKSK
ncbi:hypothetical protein MACA111363_02610 [Macrococcoides canis]|uniref:Uncharacterized protein n=1 Tax=Macrococcoides canis TaxID=1855823 RepID=A0A1W7ABR6_9STAP|nr:hypothetical protein MCCS_13900 [Macrococcus canis]